MKIHAKVIFDNGYKIELIRPLRSDVLQVGTSVIVEIDERQVDLIHTFNNLLDEKTKDMILDKFNEARSLKTADSVTTAAPVKAAAPVTTVMNKRK